MFLTGRLGLSRDIGIVMAMHDCRASGILMGGIAVFRGGVGYHARIQRDWRVKIGSEN
jgi:hypothetical protein